LKKYDEKNNIRIKMFTTEYMRRWIVIFKEMKKKAMKYTNRGDIRRYFL